jgi:uncharacterized repeat protein (TIGR01451 family)
MDFIGRAGSPRQVVIGHNAGDRWQTVAAGSPALDGFQEVAFRQIYVGDGLCQVLGFDGKDGFVTPVAPAVGDVWIAADGTIKVFDINKNSPLVAAVYAFTPLPGYIAVRVIATVPKQFFYTTTGAYNGWELLSTGGAVAGPSADLAISITANRSTAVVGDIVIYTITITNGGPNAADGCEVLLTPAAGQTITSETWVAFSAGASGGNYAPYTVDTMPAGSSATLRIRTTVSTAGTKTFIAQVNPPVGTTDPALVNNTTPAQGAAYAPTVVVSAAAIEANLSLVTSVNTTSAAVGSPVVYRFTVANAGPAAAPNTTLAATFDPLFNIASAAWGEYAAGASGGAGAAPNWSLAALPAGGSAVLVVTGSYGAMGSFAVTGTVSPPGGVTDPSLGNNTSAAAAVSVAAACVYDGSAYAPSDPPKPAFEYLSGVTPIHIPPNTVGPNTANTLRFLNVNGKTTTPYIRWVESYSPVAPDAPELAANSLPTVASLVGAFGKEVSAGLVLAPDNVSMLYRRRAWVVTGAQGSCQSPVSTRTDPMGLGNLSTNLTTARHDQGTFNGQINYDVNAGFYSPYAPGAALPGDVLIWLYFYSTVAAPGAYSKYPLV